MSAKVTDVLQLISSNYCIMKNYTLPIKLKLPEDLYVMDCGALISNIFKLKPLAGFMLTTSDCDSANQSSAAQVAVMISSYVQKTFIFPAHSAVACSEDCPWDTHVTHNDTRQANAGTQADPHTQTCTRSHRQTQTHTL